MGLILVSVLAPLCRGQICKVLHIDINCFAHPQPVRPFDLFAGQPGIGFGVCLPLPGPARYRAAESPALAVPLHLNLPSLLRLYSFCSVCPFFCLCHKKTSFGMHLPKPAQKRYHTGVRSSIAFWVSCSIQAAGATDTSGFFDIKKYVKLCISC